MSEVTIRRGVAPSRTGAPHTSNHLAPPLITTMEYYPRSHRRGSFLATDSVDTQVENGLQHNRDTASDLSADDRSIYIFPNPSSAPPSPAGLHPHTVTGCPLRSGRPRQRHRNESISSSSSLLPSSSTSSERGWDCVNSPLQLSGTNIDERGREEWDWDAQDIALEDNESVLSEEIVRASRWDLIPQHRHPQASPSILVLRMHGRPLERRGHSLDSNRRSTRSRSGSLELRPRIHFPFLSLLASLLSVDNATLSLVTRVTDSAAESALFPGSTVLAEEGEEALARTVYGPNDLLKLSSRHGALRSGLAVAYDESITPANLYGWPISPFTNFLDLVKGVWAGGKGLQEGCQ
ncbi:hypothetical protein BC834DRAFT_596216 [Gloeopeniophorella convolvens]|nr:hypothetical protein BC834DRAFT_596216 [Gloeopeniophorella convolvens]